MKNETAAGTRDPVSRTIEGLIWLIREAPDEVGVRELAAALAVPPSNAHRILATLAGKGLVRRSENTRRYSLGGELFLIAQVALGRAPVRRVALPHMRNLVRTCDETAVLGIYSPSHGEMMFAAAVDSTAPLRYAINLDEWLPIHAGASGLAILAFLSPEQRKELLRKKLAIVTSDTITNPAKLEAECKTIRERGFAITHGQRIPGAVGLAAPIFGAEGVVLGDVCITIPAHRYRRGRERDLLPLLQSTASKIGFELGAPVRKTGNAAQSQPRRKSQR